MEIETWESPTAKVRRGCQSSPNSPGLRKTGTQGRISKKFRGRGRSVAPRDVSRQEGENAELLKNDNKRRRKLQQKEGEASVSRGRAGEM